MNIASLRHALLPCLLLVAGPSRVAAGVETPVPVANGGFEELSGTDPLHFDADGLLLPGHYTVYPSKYFGEPHSVADWNSIPGWIADTAGGTVNYTGSPYLTNGLSGRLCAWMNVSGVASQPLGEAFRPNTTYHLRVDVGALLGGVPFPGAFVAFTADGVRVAGRTNAVSPQPGNLETTELVFTVGPDGPAAGKRIGIEVGIPGTGAGQVVFDNVRVSSEPGPAVPPCVPAPAGLVGWWRAGGNALDSAGTNSGIFATPQFATGQVGQAFVLDGSNEVVVLDAPALNSPEFTVEAWVYPTSYDGDVKVVVDKERAGVPGSMQYELGIRGSQNAGAGSIPTGNLAFYLDGIGGLPDGFGGWVDGGAPVPLNTWSHVALSFSPGRATAYVNGAVTRVVTNLTGSVRLNTGHLRFGSKSPDIIAQFPKARFVGRIDEVVLYNRALTPAEVALAASAGGKCADSVRPTVVTQPLSQSAPRLSPVTLSVGASGGGPFQFQWRHEGAPIANETNDTFTIPSLTAQSTGSYTVDVCNAGGCVTSAAAVVSITLPTSVVVAGTAVTTSPLPFTVPVSLVANGTEHAIGFTLRFNPAVLAFTGITPGAPASGAQLVVNASQSEAGRVGVLVSLPDGATFPEGTNEVVVAGFTPVLTAGSLTAVLSFVDSPVTREVANAGAAALPANWQSGSVAIRPASFEGDVAPPGSPDRRLTVADWVQVGRLVAGLDTVPDGPAFQAVDSAPLATAGNGLITAADWVQAGRFAAGMDPVAAVAGPASPAPIVPGRSLPGPRSSPVRAVAMAGGPILVGTTNEVAISLEAGGTENALSFSVRFDPSAVRFVDARPGAGAGMATLNFNAAGAASGRLGVALALASGTSFPQGHVEVLRIRLAAIPGSKGAASLAFADSPARREVADAEANALPTDWQPAGIGVVGPSLAARPPRLDTANGQLVLSWPTGFEGAVVESADDLSQPDWKPVVGTVGVDGDHTTFTTPSGSASRYFRLRF